MTLGCWKKAPHAADLNFKFNGTTSHIHWWISLFPAGNSGAYFCIQTLMQSYTECMLSTHNCYLFKMADLQPSIFSTCDTVHPTVE